MQNESLLSTLDPEVLERARCSRREALAKAAKAGVGAAVLTSVPVAFGLSARQAFGQTLPAGVIAVLQYALTLEYLEDEFYRTALARTALIPSDRRAIFQVISAHELAHVNLLKGVLGAANTPAKPTFDFTAGNGTGAGPYADVFLNYQTFLAVSQAFEDTGERAYKGRAAELKSTPAVLTTALQIHSIEARHAAMVRRLRGEKGWKVQNTTTVPGVAAVYAGEENTTQGGINLATAGIPGATVAALTEAFDEPLTAAQVLAIADPFIA